MSTPQEVLKSVFAQIKRDPIKISKTDYKSMAKYNGREYQKFSIFPDGVAAAAKPAWQSLVKSDIKANRAVGAMLGLAIGDAVGHPLEFIPAEGHLGRDQESWTLKTRADPSKGRLSMCLFNEDGTITYKNEFNKFQLHPGQWTDDASMSFCLADSLLVQYPNYHGGDCRGRYHFWWNHGYNNAFRHDTRPRTSVGLGGNISKSLEETMEYSDRLMTDVPEAFTSTGEDAGNGSIMRLAPVPVRYWDDLKSGYEVAVRQSRGTHPGNDAAACCVFLTYLVAKAIDRPVDSTESIQDFMAKAIQEFLDSPPMEDSGMTKVKQLLKCQPPGVTEACWDWRQPRLRITETLQARGRRYNGYPVDAGYFGAYCMDGLAMAMWSLWNSHSYSNCIFNVVNMLGDADTTGAITGQVAGAFYGLSGIESDAHGQTMLRDIARWDPDGEIPLRATLLYLSRTFK